MNFQLIGIVPDTLSADQWAIIPDLFAAGLSYLYVRQPDSEILRYRLTSDVLTPYQPQLLVPFDVPGGSFRRHWKEAARLSAPPDESAFSTSIHSLGDWPALTGRVELVFYSPVFASISKPGYGPAQPLEKVARQIETIRQQHAHLPRLIGLGGIQADTIQRVQEAGFDGAAVLGTLWQSPDPANVVRQLLDRLPD